MSIFKGIKFRQIRPRKIALSFSVFILALLIAMVSAVPIIWVIFTALKDRTKVIKNPLGPPEEWVWRNFTDAWEIGHFGTYFKNSIIVAVPTVLMILSLAMMAAYAFALMRFRGRNILFVVFLIGMTVPLNVLIVPLFYELRALGLLNTYWALILPQAAKLLPFSILLLYSFLRELPREILDSALIDGCNHWSLLRHIVLPLSRPSLLTVLIFTFMWTWNNFILPTVVIQIDKVRTLPVGLNFFQGQYVTDLPLLMAGATITFLPVILVYLVFQRHFIKGITAGALTS